MALSPEERQAITAEISQIKTRMEQRNRPEEPWYEDLAEGAAVSLMETGYGIQDLAGQVGIGGGVTDEGRATLQDWQSDAAQSGWGTGGRVLGEIAQLALPGGAALKGAKALTKAPGLARTLATIGGESAAAGGLGSLKLPNAGEDRIDRAKREAAYGALGGAAGQVLKKALRGINVSDDAKALLDEGVSLTPGQASATPFMKNVESVMEVTPILARGTKSARDAAGDSFNKTVLQKAAPEGAEITKKGTEGIAQIRKAIKQGYAKAWAKADGLTNEARKGFVDIATESAPRLSKQQKGIMKSILGDFKELTRSPTPERLKAMDNILRKRISAAATKDHDFANALKAMRKSLRKGMSDDALEALSKIDAVYPGFLAVRKASSKAAREGGVFTPDELVQAVRSVGKDLTGEGRAPLQDIAKQGYQTIGKKVGGQPLEWFRRIAGISPTPLPMQAIGKRVLGRGAEQRALDPIAEALRLYDIAPTAAGTVLGE